MLRGPEDGLGTPPPLPAALDEFTQSRSPGRCSLHPSRGGTSCPAPLRAAHPRARGEWLGQNPARGQETVRGFEEKNVQGQSGNVEPTDKKPGAPRLGSQMPPSPTPPPPGAGPPLTAVPSPEAGSPSNRPAPLLAPPGRAPALHRLSSLTSWALAPLSIWCFLDSSSSF